MGTGKIIFLNGTSSSGKSALAKGLQNQLPEPFLHVQLDHFIDMLPFPDDWDLFQRMVRGMNRSIAAMSDAELNLIVDHVVIEKSWLDQCLDLLADRYVLFVGLTCPLEELERRERKRESRRQGFARGQIDKIHRGKVYDIELDTHALSVEACVDQVIAFYNSEEPEAFDEMRAAGRSLA